MNEERERVWWDHWNTAHRMNPVDEGSAAVQLGRVVLKEVASVPIPRPSVLEVGCGTGWLASSLVERGRGYFGLDLSPASIEAARQRIPGARFAAVDFHTWTAGGEQFDLVVVVDTIAYFRDQRLAVAKIASLTKRGGYVVITTVNPFVYSRMSWVGPPGEGQVRKWLNRQALHQMVEECGLRVVRSYTVLPAGDRGILRILNWRTLNGALRLIVPDRWLRSAKERMGLGQFRVVVATRP